MNKAPVPPRLAEWLVSHSVSPSIRYGAMGDFAEVYADIAEKEGVKAADRWYWKHAIRSIPHFISDSIGHAMILFSNYMRVARRNLIKNRGSSFVNIVGLSIAVGMILTAFLFIEKQFTMDGFHEHADSIYLVENIIQQGSNTHVRGNTPAPLGPAIRADNPHVNRVVRINTGSPTFQKGEHTFGEYVFFVDSGFQDMFSFNLRLGNPDRELGPSEIILSHRTAIKYFGDESPIGQTIQVIYSAEETRDYTVIGVTEPFSSKASFSFDALLHWDQQSVYGADLEDWGTFVSSTFIEVRETDNVATVQSSLKEYVTRQNASATSWVVSEFLLDNLRNLSRHSQAVSGDISGGTHPASIIVLGVIALFMMLLACINYMNLSVATATRRLKEIGIRKAIGGARGQLVLQFLSENLLLCLMALALGILLSWGIFTPGFNLMTEDNLTFSGAETAGLWFFLAALLITTALLSGAYPALYIASFKPTEIFRGKARLGKQHWFTRGFLGFQFVLAFLTMIMGVILAQNAGYQAEKDWGYDGQNVLVVQPQDLAQFSALKAAIENVPGVQDIVGANNHFGRSWGLPTIEEGGDEFAAVRFDVGTDFASVFNIRPVAGRLFDEGSYTRTDGRVIVNEEFARSRGWTPEEAIHRSFRYDSLTYAIQGVVADFMYDDFIDPINPMFMRAIGDDAWRFMSIKISAGSSVRTEEAVKTIWKEVAPRREYTGFFQDDVFADMYRENNSIKKIFFFVAVVALLLSCMGLFGLASQNVARRKREIGIRKVLGASLPDLARKMNRSFLLVMVVAAVVSAPLGYLAMDALLGSVYADPVPIGPLGFILAYGFVMITAIGTVSTQVRKLTLTNPVDVLRNE